jgi:hypothetical protein
MESFFRPYEHIYIANYCSRVQIGVCVWCYLFSYSFFPYEIQRQKTRLVFFLILFPSQQYHVHLGFLFFSIFYCFLFRNVSILIFLFSFIFFHNLFPFPIFILLPLFFFTLRFRLFFLRLLLY